MTSSKNDAFEYKLYSAALSSVECNELIAQCKEFKAGRTTNSSPETDNDYRKALIAQFDSEPNYITKLRHYFSEVTNTNLHQQETPVSIIKYEEGGFYLPHLDCFGGIENIPNPQAGDRLLTGIAYLNDNYSGGETIFPSENISIKGRQGDLLVWYNLNKNGSPNRNTKHSGGPVVKGSKYIAVIWARERSLEPLFNKTLL